MCQSRSYYNGELWIYSIYTYTYSIRTKSNTFAARQERSVGRKWLISLMRSWCLLFNDNCQVAWGETDNMYLYNITVTKKYTRWHIHLIKMGKFWFQNKERYPPCTHSCQFIIMTIGEKMIHWVKTSTFLSLNQTMNQ